MTQDPASTEAEIYAQVMQTYEAEARRRAELRGENKIDLFNALEAAGIARVIVEFDGYGDSGQIESIQADDLQGRRVAMPAETIAYRRQDRGQDLAQTNGHTLYDAVEAMAYACLAETHPGWENNDGADGSFIFETKTRTIHLEHNQRYTDTTTYEHEF